MADRTIGELPALTAMTADTKIPVEHDSEAKSMAGHVLQDYVRDTVDAEVPIIARIVAVGPKGDDGVSPTLTANKTGKITTIYYTDADHQSGTDVLAELRDGADGAGTGDMVKATYDANDNGVVDDAEKLGGQLPKFYQALVLEENDPDAYAALLAEWPTSRPVIVLLDNAECLPVSVSRQPASGFFFLAGVIANGSTAISVVFVLQDDGSWSGYGQSIAVDTVPTQGSSNLITSGAVYTALGDIESILEAML